jgi:mono/diheme cytochrome c family protein
MVRGGFRMLSPALSHLLSRAGVSAFALLAMSAAGTAADVEGLRKTAAAFFEKHCLDCHESGTTKGGLNLEKVDAAMTAAGQTEMWAHIYDRLAHGEMPPAKKPQPSRAEVEALLAQIRPRLMETDRARREVVQRRLNRTEYENTVRDLLAIDIDLKQYLPEDQQAGGFDNNGDALALSTEQMQGYLAAARAALDAAIVTGEQPKTETWTVDALSEVKKYIDTGEFGYVDGRIVTFVTNDGDYSKISTRAKRPKVRGRYRLKFQAASQETGELGFFMISASHFGPGAKNRNVGYFECGPEPKTFEVETVLDAKEAVQFFGLGLPG